MKQVPEALAAGLASGVTTHALCWRLTRADAVQVGVTDHDRAITLAGLVHEPGGSFGETAFTARGNLAPDPVKVEGALSSDAISAADLEAGLWDRARVDVFRVDWSGGAEIAAQDALHVWSGYLTAIRRRGAAFEAELISLKGDLEAQVGRTLTRRCGARLGDARCGVDTTLPMFAGLTCDRRFGTCVDVFANAENFRGFPDLPGNDALVSGAGEARDGSSRRKGLP